MPLGGLGPGDFDGLQGGGERVEPLGLRIRREGANQLEDAVVVLGRELIGPTVVQRDLGPDGGSSWGSAWRPP
eukprot:5542672-Alexandrium_andersonii.AAC.1